MKNLLLLFCFISALLVPLQTLSTEINSKEMHDHISSLEERINSAAKQQALWRDTDKLLSEAKEQLAKNNLAHSQELIDQVEFQLKQSLQQSHNQPDIDKLVPYYLKH